MEYDSSWSMLMGQKHNHLRKIQKLHYKLLRSSVKK